MPASKNKPLPQAVTLPTAEERPTMSVPEVCVILGISRQHGYHAVNAGDIPAIRLGRKVLVPTAELRRLLGVDAA